MALALAAKGSADASAAMWCSALAALWVGAAAIPMSTQLPLTTLGIGVAALVMWMGGTNLIANPYNAAAQYQAAFLLGGYLYGRRAAATPGLTYGAVLVFGMVLAGLALWQVHATGDQRAHGPLITPATFATVINLLLLPALVLIAVGWRRPALLAIVGVLVAALLASASRGGWLALAGAAVATYLLLRRAGLPVARCAITTLGGSLLLIGLGALTWNYTTLGARATASFQSRLELYRLAFIGLEPSTWLFGAGYGAFYYLLEGGRALVPSYASVTTYFVHNDYLQVLYELGLPGLLALLYLVVAPVVKSWRTLPHLLETDRTVAIAALAAIISMALHALVDFPFFVPLCVLLYGGALGILDVTLTRAAPQVVALPSARTKGLKAAAVTLAVWVLAVPMAAEAAAAYAEKQWRKADAQRAAFWFEAARRIDARDWRYHWYAAQFWLAHAGAYADPAAARQADVALAAAISANPREVRPLYSRIELHLRVPSLLERPAEAQTLRAWADRAATLAPADPVVQAARQRVLRYFPK